MFTMFTILLANVSMLDVSILTYYTQSTAEADGNVIYLFIIFAGIRHKLFDKL